MKRSLIWLVGVMACGGSSEPPVEEVSFGDDEVVEGETEQHALHALFEAEIDGMRAADPDAALASHSLDADSFMLGPVARSVMVGGEAVNGAVRQVMSSWEPMEVTAREHVFEIVGDAAFSGHEVVFVETDDPITYHAVQLYRRSAEGWKVVATSWTIAMGEERFLPMAQAGAFPESAPIPARLDPGCENAAADLEGLRNDRLPPTERVLGSFTLGAEIGEAQPFDQAQYDELGGLIESGVIESGPGPGGVHAQRIGDLCFAVTSVNRTVHMQDQELTIPMRAFVVYDTRTGTHRLGSFSVVLPEGPPPAEGAEAEEAEEAEPPAE